MTDLAPIGIPVYNRINHTKMMITSLLNNKLASDTEVYFFCDNYKSKKDQCLVDEVRSFIFSIQGFKKINIILRDKNFGLSKNTIDGVEHILKTNEKFIWLEDDIIVSKFFLDYMNEALHFYKNNKKIMSITGYAYPIKDLKFKESIALSRLMQCWSWGTWKNKWNYFKKDKNIMSLFNKEMIHEFTFEGANPNFWKQIEWNINGKINTWAVFWYASIFLNDGLCVIPREAYAINVGHDGSGHHTQPNRYFDNILSNSKKFTFINDTKENEEYFYALKKYFISIQPSIYERLISRFNQFINL